MARYISQPLREDLVKILVSVAVIEDFKVTNEAKYKDLFSPKAWGWMKQSYTLIMKAMSQGLAPNIGDEESNRIRELTKRFKIILLRNSEALPTDHTSVPTKQLYNLAEIAIGKQCIGCTIAAYKACPLYLGLRSIDMPRACDEKGKCRYLQ
jgi:hypothetical protein